MDIKNAPLEILKQYWNYDQFRPLQSEIINSILSDNHTLALLPTGGGKSICYQIPALCLPGITVVVSPLIALMKDQIQHLHNKNISATLIHSGLTFKEVKIELNNIKNGKYKMVYVSPERLKSEITLEYFNQTEISLIAIDEAHCISTWGYDFRPEYLNIGDFIKTINNVKVVALTASATPLVCDDIISKLNMINTSIFKGSYYRPNLNFIILKNENKALKTLQILEQSKESSIVYVRSRKATSDLNNFLITRHIKSEFYHAGMPQNERDFKQEYWQSNKVKNIVCTNAFGMGIDKPDVKYVIHAEATDALEAYYQEAGRAGRNGKNAYCILFFDQQDKHLLNNRLESKYLSHDFLIQLMNALYHHFQIPIGGGLDQQYEIDIENFMHLFNFNKTDVRAGIKLLEHIGKIKVNEAFFNSSRMMILVNQITLYEFQLKYPKIDIFIKTLLRMYGGLFDYYTPIKEFEIAGKLKTSINTVSNTLQKLQKHQIIDYIPQNQKPEIIFLHERQTHTNIDYTLIKILKDNAKIRLQSMLEFIEKNECKQKLLVAYFGETLEQNCGKCSYCRNDEPIESKHQRWEVKIKTLLERFPISDQELISQLGNSNAKLIDFVRLLIDNETLILNENNKLIWNKNT